MSRVQADVRRPRATRAEVDDLAEQVARLAERVDWLAARFEKLAHEAFTFHAINSVRVPWRGRAPDPGPMPRHLRSVDAPPEVSLCRPRHGSR